MWDGEMVALHAIEMRVKPKKVCKCKEGRGYTT